VYLAEMQGADAFQQVYQKPLVLVLGSESHGVKMDIDRKVVNSVSIPRKGKMTESLNVGVAGSILLAEISR
jgi:TrmH family RNA methyltransferase